MDSCVKTVVTKTIQPGQYGCLQIVATALGNGQPAISFYLNEVDTIPPSKLRDAAKTLVEIADFYERKVQ